MTQYFTFRAEVLQKYDIEVYEAFMELFDNLPVASVVNGLYFCVHGGLSPDLFEVDDINQKIDRFQETPCVGLACDLLWSDPVNDEQEDSAEVNFLNNTDRSCSYLYGMKPVKQFLRRERLLCLVRAHEVKIDGYEMAH